MTLGRCSRGVRAATFAAVCVLLASTGHVLMSGQDLTPPAVGLAFTGTLAIAWILAGRERGLIAVTAATVAVQGVLHAVFSWAQSRPMVSASLPSDRPSDRPTPVDAPSSHASMDHMGMGHTGVEHMGTGHMGMSHEAMGHMSPGTGPVAHDMTDMGTSLGMLSAHLLAALVSGLWMAYGERAVFRLVRALPLWLFRPLRLLLAAVVPVTPRPPRLRAVRAGDEHAPRQLLLAHSVISRGPPPAFAVS